MTDRELLELAAKTANIKNIVFIEDYGVFWNEAPDYPGLLFNNCWNPLKDSRQAFSLFVELGMLTPSMLGLLVMFRAEESIISPESTEEEIMRRAIVRVAAEEGQNVADTN